MGEYEEKSSIPTELEISIAGAEEALRYWLSNVVLRNEVRIESVQFSQKDNGFKIRLER